MNSKYYKRENVLEKNLVIIGNGFDLAHNLKTKWSDFKDYLCQFNIELLDILEGCITTEIKNDLWSDFEKNLGKINRKEIYAEELFGFDMIKNDEDERRNHQMADRIRYIEDLIIDGTKRTLNNWILSIDVNVHPFKNIQRILKNAQVISFNYTSTLETSYDISPNNIVYLHGKAVELSYDTSHDYFESKPVPKIVVGHGEKIEPIDIGTFADDMSDEIVLDEVQSEGHRDVLLELKKDTVKYISRLNHILSSMDDYDNIYIIGHSLSDIDAPYFHNIASRIAAHTKIFVTYFKDGETKSEKKDRVKHFFPQNEVLFEEIENLL